MFFGRDLLKMQPGEGRVWLGHNRDVGMLAHERLVVLGLMQSAEFYEGDPKVAEVSLLRQPLEADRELEKDAIACYQVADDLYTHRRYRIDGTLPGPVAVREASGLAGADTHPSPFPFGRGEGVIGPRVSR
jgi:hypothetical protein